MSQKNVQVSPSISSAEQGLLELLATYATEHTILPEKDRLAKLALLRVYLKQELLRLSKRSPALSFKQAVIELGGLLPENSSGDAFHAVVDVATKYWPAVSADFQHEESSAR